MSDNSISDQQISRQGERNLTIEQWHELAKSGAAPKMQITLQGDSMRPLIRRGIDPVTIVPLTRPLKRGDVVLFEYPKGRYVVHRVYKLSDNKVQKHSSGKKLSSEYNTSEQNVQTLQRVQTLGDNCWNPEPWLPITAVWGLVREYSRSGKVHRLDTPSARMFGIVWSKLLGVRRCYRRIRALVGRVLRKVGLRR